MGFIFFSQEHAKALVLSLLIYESICKFLANEDKIRNQSACRRPLFSYLSIVGIIYIYAFRRSGYGLAVLVDLEVVCINIYASVFLKSTFAGSAFDMPNDGFGATCSLTLRSNYHHLAPNDPVDIFGGLAPTHPGTHRIPNLV
jgi:hypothetical protein